ncbi:MAG: ABC transporter ATP-binding protein [Candidatus Thermoplasmatota archaeon]|nr:ABC transporter ATP-binding protein [Candidatus Thermoplasmatota archaeon]
MTSEPLVETKDLGKRFGEFIALHPLDVTVFAGEFFGVFGPNGAGKSTFIKLLTGQLTPSLGFANVLGTNVAKNPQKVKANVGIVPESESPPSYLTAAEYLDFVCKIRNVEDASSKVKHWLDWFGIDDRSDTLCKDLSKGQRQKVMLASAFIHEPRLLFLDEPFVNLDPIYQRKCRTLLIDHIAAGGTIFLCSHILEVAERMCTRVAVIDHGKVLASGTLDELRENDNEDLEDIFIRLVGASVEEIESLEGSKEEEE